ncbi:hypothetical protein PUNSTDRAFT_41874 [Punctularia strigosozonata HHB-11173 SS5]|uniref:uncharacterized protein n=1 Tax=Punctularia strigosozonata (strain HHB-11173) TaxID=741275 RepID=UPI0004416E7B|nr:uncharacterized protein PUNSTDRAFT_41874 [Punctularia strigosozonata HHB-11173 SS5]EIN12112.1 hypothetical protein PUNSTDRAFT_41874 [Punctularia strigosozonata HHB-11173 SS5]
MSSSTGIPQDLLSLPTETLLRLAAELEEYERSQAGPSTSRHPTHAQANPSTSGRPNPMPDSLDDPLPFAGETTTGSAPPSRPHSEPTTGDWSAMTEAEQWTEAARLTERSSQRFLKALDTFSDTALEKMEENAVLAGATIGIALRDISREVEAHLRLIQTACAIGVEKRSGGKGKRRAVPRK